MEFTIYYYSATGNSLHAAKSIAEKLPNCKLISMTSVINLKKVVAHTEGVGFVFPTHYFGLPPLVIEFIKKLDVEKATYFFAAATCGSRYISSVLRQLDKLLMEKAKSLHAGFHVEMVSSYIPLSNIPPEHKVQKRLAKAEKKIEEIVTAIVNQQQRMDAEYLWRPSVLINHHWREKSLSKANEKFSVSSSCTSCSYCTKICPVNNIRMVKGRPEWMKGCQECLACLHFCPAQSIEFGTRTAGRRRYHHPKISPAELIGAKEPN